MEIKENEVYTQRETQELLKVSASTVTRMIKKGLIRTARVGKQYRILGKELLRILSPELEDKVGIAYNKARNWAHADDPTDDRLQMVCLLARKAGLECLKSLIQKEPEYKIATLFTHRYLPKSEARTLTERPEYKQYVSLAKIHGITLIAIDQPSEAKSLDEKIKGGFDYLISCNWRYLVAEDVLERAALGCINLHRGKLPQYAGAEPVKRALRDGQKEIVITAHLMTDEIDKGEVLAEAHVSAGIKKSETLDDAVTRIKSEIAPIYPKVLFEAIKKIEQTKIKTGSNR